MKKMLKSALALAMGAVMLMPVTAFAAEDEPTLISTQEVALSPSGANTRSAETKEFTLSTYGQIRLPTYTSPFSLNVQEKAVPPTTSPLKLAPATLSYTG